MTQKNKTLSQGNKIQEVFLNHCRKNNISVNVDCDREKIINGYIIGFDRDSIVFESKGRQSLIYKTCIKSIEPQACLNFILNDKRVNNNHYTSPNSL